MQLIKPRLEHCLSWFLLFSWFTGSSLLAQEQDMPASLNLAELLDLDVSIATKSETNLRETPGIVSVVTREQMLAMGARDVIDVIQRMVPGFSIVTEIEGAQLLSIRGLNAIDGKFLVMINGLDINGEKFGIVQFAKHFPIHALERIEIIRGPGSSIYGGYSSLGVIHLITRNDQRPGSYSIVDAEQGHEAFINGVVSSGYAGVEGDLKGSVNLTVSQGVLNDGTSTSFYGDPITLSDAKINSLQGTWDIKYADTYAKGLIDLYRAPAYYFDEPNEAPWQHIRERWDTYQIEIGHSIEASEALSITPYANYKLQYPYWIDQGPYWFRNKVDRTMAGFNVSYRKGPLSILGGYQGFIHTIYRAENLNLAVNEEVLRNDPDIDRISYRNDSVFAQMVYSHSLANITLGARYDKTDIHGSFFAPRVGLTKVWSNLHIKFMTAQSFRVPGGIIPNRVEDANKFEIDPETTLNNELELGYQFGKHTWVAVNLFDHIISDPIRYSPGDSGIGSYRNEDPIGTRGFELDFRYIKSRISSIFTYAYYEVTENDTDDSLAPDHPKESLGQSRHKLNWVLSLPVAKNLSINPSVVYLGETFAYTEQGAVTGVDDSGDEQRADPELQTLAPQGLVNVNLRYQNLIGITGFEGSLGIQNLGNQDVSIAQPYKAEYPVAPLPFGKRSLLLRLLWEH